MGQGPGNAELNASKAFAGQSGRTLDSWLVSAGADVGDPRSGLYLTSIIKCCHSSPGDFPLMAQLCAPFLQRQIEFLRPRLVITLGRQAYLRLRLTPKGYNEALCGPVHTSDHLLVSQFGFHFWLLPWPHPSGLNRWHNSIENRERLERSFAFVRSVLEGSSEEG